MEFDQYLQLLITPKIHIIEDHSCEQQSIFNSIGYLEETFVSGIISKNQFHTGNMVALVNLPFVRR